MKPQAYEALQKAKALFRHPAEVRHEDNDDIPESITQAPEPIRKPRVVLLPINAPKFDKETMKQEHKNRENGLSAQQTDKYVEMSTAKAIKACLAKGITKPAEIQKETGKNINQIYTQLWKIKQSTSKAKPKVAAAKPFKNIKPVSDDFDPRREPTAYEDAHMVVLKSREQYESEITEQKETIMRLHNEITRLKIVVEYLEGRTK